MAVLALSPAACRRPESAPTGRREPADRPPDSLVLRLSPDVEIWFTAGREDRDSAGTVCFERSLEVRRSGRRIPVPLLYTGSTPIPDGDSSLEAELWLACRPVARYRIDLITGRPAPIRAGARAAK